MQGYVVYRIRVRRGGRKRPVSKGIVYGKPKNQGITQLKFQRNLRSVAEERAGRKLGGLRVLNSYWINQVCLFLAGFWFYATHELCGYRKMWLDCFRISVQNFTGAGFQMLCCVLHTGFYLQILWGDSYWHSTLCDSEGPTYQLDCEPCAQAPWAQRVDLSGQEAPGFAWQGSFVHQGTTLCACNLETQQLSFSKALSLRLVRAFALPSSFFVDLGKQHCLLNIKSSCYSVFIVSPSNLWPSCCHWIRSSIINLFLLCRVTWQLVSTAVVLCWKQIDCCLNQSTVPLTSEVHSFWALIMIWFVVWCNYVCCLDQAVVLVFIGYLLWASNFDDCFEVAWRLHGVPRCKPSVQLFVLKTGSSSQLVYTGFWTIN